MKKFLRILFLYIPVGFIAASILMTVLLKWVPVAVTPLMVKRCFQHIEVPVKHKWKPLKEISPEMVKAVVTSEDNRFFEHNGFDFKEIDKMQREHYRRGKPVRGCSTISQQTAKNCFTWCTRTWTRKAFEAYYTLLIEKIWGKRRIMEVYLNVVELGPGIYGVEAAAQHFYDKKAKKLTRTEAATLACCLPNPLKRNPAWVGKHMPRTRAGVIRRIPTLLYPDWLK